MWKKHMAKRKIIVTSSFKRDIKRRYLELVTAEWAEVLDCLVANNPLPEKYLDHPLKGGAELKNCRDCHVKPDLVLIYRLLVTIFWNCISWIAIPKFLDDYRSML